jgi:hypothetical protein
MTETYLNSHREQPNLSGWGFGVVDKHNRKKWFVKAVITLKITTTFALMI